MNDKYIALPQEEKAHLVTSRLFHLPLLNQNSHKGDNGRVLIIAGSSLFHGASELTALGVIETLIRFTSITNDAVFFCSTKENIAALKQLTPVFIGVQREELDEYIERSDVILVGPGLMREPQIGRPDSDDEPKFTKNITRKVLESAKKVVLDAGSLQVISPNDLQMNSRTIVTPHHGEMAQLFRLSSNDLLLAQSTSFEQIKIVAEKVQQVASEYRTTILLKGPIDIIANSQKWYFSPGGNAGMTKGGTGDILAGVTAALYNSIHDPIEAASLASFLLKRTAEELVGKYGTFYDAYDVTKNISDVFEGLRKSLTSLRNHD